MKNEQTQSQIYASQKFGIQQSDVYAFHSGNYYDRVMVTTEEAATTVIDKLKDKYVSGGCYEGMRLGYCKKIHTEEGIMVYDIMC